MRKSKIKEFVSANTIILKGKLYSPIFFTILLVAMLIDEYLDASNDLLILASYTLFRVIYIIGFWAMYFFSHEYAELNGLVFENASNDSPVFDENDERIFQQIKNKFDVYFLTLIFVSVLLEIYRYVYGFIVLSNNLKITIYICLLAICFISFIMSLLKSIKLLTFIKGISVNRL